MSLRSDSWAFPQRVLLVAAILVLLLLVARLADVLVLVFGSIVVACAIAAGARPLQRRWGLSRRMAVLATLAAVAAAVALFGALVGDAVAQQVAELSERLPQALKHARTALEKGPLGRQLVNVLANLPDELGASRLASMMNLTLGAVGGVLLMMVLGFYLAADTGTYRDGLVRLVGPRHRSALHEALDAAAHALTRWLLGQAVSMVFLGATTTIGLLVLGAPLPLALGLITGLLAFVPLIGAIVAGVLSTLAAFTAGPSIALYVALMFVALQQVEEYLLVPLVQRWAVSLPPPLGLLAAVVFGVLLGPLGVVFATPLMVVSVALTQQLYIERVLERLERPRQRPAQDRRSV